MDGTNASVAPDPNAPRYCEPALCMTESEVLRYRTITTILGHTNAIDKDITIKGTSLDYSHIYKHGNVSKAYRWLANLTDLLARHHEIIAVTPTADLKSMLIAENEEVMADSEDPCEIFDSSPIKDDDHSKLLWPTTRHDVSSPEGRDPQVY